ncbi:HAMP domain-containing histidine kinase [Permianibacter sp. IMCC34836]|uniref:sensor histidine kinase n=1 Tax=Permianibacter fluminis TaxID=2738515 RepID=UPI001554ED0F|nr:HAMP domain-containing sensor histidine kinase [Permianibacter fluminis]NQD38203.1 HAMP domain-containing histidine kinase [Permianibacter fluminis]
MSEPSALFPTVLASSVHDIKNSLGMLLQSLEAVVERVPVEQRPGFHELAVLQYEAARVNNSLVQLLALYKLDNQQLPLNIGHHMVADFLQEQGLRNQNLLNLKQIQLDIEVDDDLAWYFDYDLIASVIDNIITNSIRYTHSKLLLRADIEDDQLVIVIADDGPGYPRAMLETPDRYLLGINRSTGSTGLGLFFAGEIARLHRRADVHGRVQLRNGQCLEGGEFRLYLP